MRASPAALPAAAIAVPAGDGIGPWDHPGGPARAADRGPGPRLRGGHGRPARLFAGAARM